MSVQVARIHGIPIRLHFTLIIVFFLIAWTLASGFMPQYFRGLTVAQYWTMGVLGAVILFISVLLHELMHSIVAQHYGIKVRQIILFIFGGVSDIPEETRDFRKEFKIAIVGPAMSFAIAGILTGIWLVISSQNVTTESGSLLMIVKQMASGVLLYGAIVNALVGVFNLIPAFPLDGGRVLRAALIRWKRDYNSATRVAARVGIAISYGFMGIGFLFMITGSFIGGVWFLLIGWFLNSGAQSYLSQQEITNLLSGVRLRDIMNTRVITVEADTSVDELIKKYFGVYMKSGLAVIDDADHLLGMVTLKRALDVSEDKRYQITAREIMIPLQELVIMLPNARADEALMNMTRKRIGKVFVCNNQGILMGLVSKTDIMNVANERQHFHQELRKKSAISDSETV